MQSQAYKNACKGQRVYESEILTVNIGEHGNIIITGLEHHYNIKKWNS